MTTNLVPQPTAAIGDMGGMPNVADNHLVPPKPPTTVPVTLGTTGDMVTGCGPETPNLPGVQWRPDGSNVNPNRPL